MNDSPKWCLRWVSQPTRSFDPLRSERRSSTAFDTEAKYSGVPGGSRIRNTCEGLQSLGLASLPFLYGDVEEVALTEGGVTVFPACTLAQYPRGGVSMPSFRHLFFTATLDIPRRRATDSADSDHNISFNSSKGGQRALVGRFSLEHALQRTPLLLLPHSAHSRGTATLSIDTCAFLSVFLL